MTQCWCDTVPAPSVSDDTVPSVHHGADVMQSCDWSDIVIWWLLSFVTDWCNVFAAVRLFDWTVTLELSVNHSVSVCRPHHCIQGRWSDKLAPRFTDPTLRGKVRKYVGALPRNLHAKVSKSVHKSTPWLCVEHRRMVRWRMYYLYLGAPQSILAWGHSECCPGRQTLTALSV